MGYENGVIFQNPPVIAAQVLENIGVLTNNDMLVESLRSALSAGEHGFKLVPQLVEEIIEEGAWKNRIDRNGRPFRFGPKEFRKFIRDPEPDGLGTTEDEIRKYLGGSDNPLRLTFEAAIAGGHEQETWKDQPRSDDGSFMGRLPNNIRESDDAQPSDSVPKPRDRSREPQAGTSIGYIVRRLERAAKDDPAKAEIRDRLTRGEITANAAGLLAGFYLRKITVPLNPEAAGRLLARHFNAEQLERLYQAALSASADRMLHEGS